MSTTFLATETARDSTTLTVSLVLRSTTRLDDPCGWVALNKSSILGSLQSASWFVYLSTCTLVVANTLTAGYSYQLQAVFSTTPSSDLSATNPGSAVICVDTVKKTSDSILVALDTTSMVTGQRAWVKSVDRYYRWAPKSALPVIGLARVASTTSQGLWIADTEPSARYQAQTAWVLTSDGDDDNEGSSTSPIKTFAEYLLRTGTTRTVPINTAITVEAQYSISAEDPFACQLTLLEGSSLTLKCKRVALRTANLSSATQKDRANNQPLVGFDTGLSSEWSTSASTSYIDKQIVFDKSTGEARAWTVKDLLSQSVRISTPTTFSSLTPATATVPGLLGTEVYTVYDFLTIENVNVEVTENSSGTFVVENVGFSATRTPSISGSAVVASSLVPGGVFKGVTFVDCSLGSLTLFGASTVQSGYVTGTLQVQTGSSLRLFLDPMLQGGRISYATGFQGNNTGTEVDVVDWLGAFDTGGAVDVPINGVLVVGSGLWGSNNTSYAVSLGKKATLAYTRGFTAFPIAGSGSPYSDFLLGGAQYVSPINPTTGVVYGPVVCSWANLEAARPGGFGYNVQHPENLAAVVSLS